MADKKEKDTKKTTSSKTNTSAKKETTKKEVVKKDGNEVKKTKTTVAKTDKKTNTEPKKEVKKETKKEPQKEIKKEVSKETKIEDKKSTTPKVEVKEEKKSEAPKGKVTIETKKFEIKNTNSNNKTSTSGNSKKIAGIIIVLAVIAIVALLTILIVTSSDPKKSVDGYLTNLKAGDFEKAQEFTTGEYLLKDNNFSDEVKRLLFDRLSWKVKNVTTDNNSAIVEIEITNKDFSQVLQNWTKRLLSDVRAVLGKTVDTSKYFEEELKNDNLQTKTVTGIIKLEKQDKKWKVIVNKDLEEILLPELENSMNYVQ